jgi:hypothetical protein
MYDLAENFDGISVQFVFGSEEYPEWVNTDYNDVMGIFLNGEQIAFDDDGNPITINGPFFNSGSVVTSNGTTYDGSTGLLVTQAPLAGGTTGNVLELVVCDGGDGVFDSGMFVAWLNGCVGDDCSGTVPCEVIDDDADGYSSCEDCDDTNPYVNPGAAEECDGVDNDCDAGIDEGDVCCDDTDGDGFCDEDDNCVEVPNEDQADGDGDGYGDVCDVCPLDNPDDSDSDGVCESDDICPGGDDTVDTDGDDVPDFCDDCPLDFYDDSDGDGSCDSDDICPGGDDSVDTDGDGTPDDCDVCPLDYYDDSDSDGLCDSDDACDGTSGGDIIDETGCSIEDYCPCDGGWMNHGEYVSCVAHATNDFVDLGLISEDEKGDIQSDAGSSNCGHKAKGGK